MSRLAVLAASLVSAGLATLITSEVVERQMLKDYDDRLQKELEASIEHLKMYVSTPRPTEEVGAKGLKGEQPVSNNYNVTVINPAEGQTMAEAVEEARKSNQLVRYDKVVQNSFVGEDISDEDLAEAIDEDELEIYAIPTEDFMENENGWLQASISYYADGGVLDDQGEIVVDWQDMIGNTVPPFGMLSDEPHVVYLRNVKLKREFEVIKDDAKAADILADPASP